MKRLDHSVRTDRLVLPVGFGLTHGNIFTLGEKTALVRNMKYKSSFFFTQRFAPYTTTVTFVVYPLLVFFMPTAHATFF